MGLRFLETGAGQPSEPRNVLGLVLKPLGETNEVWMFDCDEGTQRQILETTIEPRKVKRIFIMHLHGNHIFGSPRFLTSRAFQANEEQTDLDIYGPIGIRSYILSSLYLSEARLPYRIHFHKFDENNLGKIIKTDKFVVHTEELDHTIFCIGYCVMQKDLEGTFDAEALKAAGVPSGPLFDKTKGEQDVILEDGIKTIAKDYISTPEKGKIITILGDTHKTNASVHLGLGAGILVYESTYGKGDERIAHKHSHSTNIQAAQITKEASAKMLLLDHISARFLGREYKQVENDAKTVFENTHLVKDLEEVSL